MCQTRRLLPGFVRALVSLARKTTLACFATLLLVAPAAGQTIIDWTAGGATDYYLTAANWTGLDVPNDTTESARFNLAGNYNVTLKFTGTTTVSDLLINAGNINFATDAAGVATYNTDDDMIVNGGNFTLSESGGAEDVILNVGDELDVTGDNTFTVELGSDVTAANLDLGTSGSGDGNLTVDGAGSTLMVTTSTDLGTSGSIGTLTFQNGSTGNSLSGPVDLMAGSSVAGSTGRLNVLSGSTLQTGNINVGQSGSVSAVQEGKLTVDGTNSDLTMTGASTLTVGDDVNPNVVSDVIISGSGTMSSGTGNILIRNSGHLDIQSSSTFNANGNVTVDGATIDRAFSGAFNNGVGITLIAQNSAQLNFDGDQTIDNGASWTLETGADYNTDSSTDDLFVGNITDGTLVVENPGSTLEVGNGTSGFTQIGENAATGTVTVRDFATAHLGTLDIADDNDAGTTGVLNIEDGATVTTFSIDMASGFTTTNVLTAEINIGSVTTHASLTMTGGNSLDVGATTAAAGSSATINVNDGGDFISGTSSINIRESGLVNIDGGYFQANGNVNVSEGELRMTSLSPGNFDLETGLTLTASSGGQVTFNRFYDLDDNTTFQFQTGADFTQTSGIDVGGNGVAGSTHGRLIGDGIGTTLDVDGTTSIGKDDGNGTLILRNGATGEFSTVNLVNSPDTVLSGLVSVETGATATSFSLNINTLSSGNFEGSAGVMNITGAGSSWTASSLTLGNDVIGKAEINVKDAGSFTTTSSATFHEQGVMTIDGGTVSLSTHIDSGGTIDFINGSLTSGSDWVIEGGGLIGNVVDLTPGKHLATTGGSDDVFLEPTGTLILDGGSLDVDDFVDNGGTFQFNSGTLTLRGFNAFNIDAATIFGTAYTLAPDQHVVISSTGRVAAGSILTLSGGTLNGAGHFDNFGTTVVGAGSQLVTNSFDNESSGILVIGPNSSMRLTTTGSETNFGEIQLAGGSATLQFDGSNFNNNELIRGDGMFLGNLTNSSTGELRASFGERLRITGTNGSNVGMVNLQGGTVEFDNALTNSSGDIVGRGTLIVGGAGLTNTGDVTLSSGISDVFGDVANDPGGRVIISGNADVTFWDNVDNNGTLFRVSAGSSVTVFGNYSGTSMTGTGDKYLEGNVSPGFSPAAIDLDGDVFFGVASQLNIELGGTAAGSEYDQVNIGDVATLEGTLNVTTIDVGGGLFNPQLGDSFDVLTATGGIAGAFDTENLPTLDPGLYWDVEYGSTVLTLDVIDYILGDMNGDGLVNLDDVPAFVLALVDRPAYDLAYPTVNEESAGDISEDGVFDFGDINLFSAVMSNFKCDSGNI